MSEYACYTCKDTAEVPMPGIPDEFIACPDCAAKDDSEWEDESLDSLHQL